MGVWFTRWFDWNALTVQQGIIDEYRSRQLPLAALVLDMNWHTKQGWGGYSFDRHLYPYPDDFQAQMHAQGLGTLCNLHDDDGIRSNEDEYMAMASAIGFDTSSNATIPFE